MGSLGLLRGVAVGVVPAARQKQPPVQQAGSGVGDRMHADPGLSIADLAQGSGVLAGQRGEDLRNEFI